MLIMPSLTLIAWKLRSNWTLFYPICGMFCCLKVRWENLVTFCEVRLSWHKVSILSMSKVRKPRDSKPRQRYLSDEEWSRLLTACKASTHRMLYPITILSLATGARYSELINLKFSNVDFQRNIVYFYKTNNQQPNFIILS